MSISFKYLLSKKLRLFIVIGVVGNILALIIMMNSLLPGFKETLVSHRKSTSFDYMVTPNFSKGESGLPFNTSKFMTKLKNIKDIKKAEPILEFNQVIRLKDKNKKAQAISYIDGLTDLQLIEGRLPKKANDVVIDVSLRAEEGMKIGSVFSVKGKKFKVAGLTQGHRIYSQAYVFYKFSSLRRLYEINKNHAHYYLIASQKGGSEVNKQLKKVFTGYQIIKGSDYIKSLEDHYAFMNSLFVVIETLALGIGLLVIGSVMFTSVNERKQEIGILRAIGASSYFVINMVFIESLVLSIASLVVGIFMGWLLIVIFPKMVYIQATLKPDVVLSASMYSIIISVTGSFLAARKALRVDPVDSIRSL